MIKERDLLESCIHFSTLFLGLLNINNIFLCIIKPFALFFFQCWYETNIALFAQDHLFGEHEYGT